MHELTEVEIDQISIDIDQQGLTYVRLRSELLDHICCQIEEEMEAGMTFNEAYHRVKQNMGARRILQIQDETMYLINKKYRRMKKLVYGLGIAVPVLIIVGLLFKTQHWPGATLMLSLGLFTLAVLFLPAFVMVRIRDTRQQNEPVPMGLYITGMIGGILTTTGSLLKIQHMYGASVLLTLGLITIAAVFLPMFAVVRFRASSEKKEYVNRGFFIVGVIAGILFFTGALFKLMHWPGAGTVILITWLIVAVIFLPLMVLNILKQKENRINNFFFVVLSLSILSVLLLALTRKSPSHELKTYVNVIENMVSNAGHLESQCNILMKTIDLTAPGEIPKNLESVSAEADKICDFIQTARKEMVLAVSENNEAAIQVDGEINFREVYGIELLWPSQEILFVTDEEGGKAYRLRLMLESFREKSLAFSEDEDLRVYIRTNLDLSDRSIEKTWEEYYFTGAMLVAATNLTMYQSTVRLIEFELIRELSTRKED